MERSGIAYGGEGVLVSLGQSKPRKFNGIYSGIKWTDMVSTMHSYFLLRSFFGSFVGPVGRKTRLGLSELSTRGWLFYTYYILIELWNALEPTNVTYKHIW